MSILIDRISIDAEGDSVVIGIESGEMALTVAQTECLIENLLAAAVDEKLQRRELPNADGAIHIQNFQKYLEFQMMIFKSPNQKLCFPKAHVEKGNVGLLVERLRRALAEIHC